MSGRRLYGSAEARDLIGLGDGNSYLEWLETVGMIDGADRTHIHKSFTSAQLDDTAHKAIELREWLRPVIRDWTHTTDTALSHTAVARLNKLMAPESRFSQIVEAEGGSELEQRSRWDDPSQLLAVPARAAAELMTTGEPSLVRQCEGCTMWFYDHTKGHRRRWCSQALCGNRAKARAFRERHATSEQH